MKKMMKKLLNTKMKFTSNQKGLTLIELLVVIVILGIIAAIAIPMVMSNSDKAQLNANEQNRQVLQDAVNRYYALNPTAASGSVTKALLIPGSTAEGAPFIQEIPTCPDTDGKDIMYTVTDTISIPKGCAGGPTE